MRRRELFALFGATAIWPSAADAQADRTWRIGFLDAGQEASRRPMFDVFRRRMAELGYVEGGNLGYRARSAEGRFERLPELVNELLAANPDALLVATTPGGLAAKAATSTVPIVFVAVADPVRRGACAEPCPTRRQFDRRHQYRGRADGEAARNPQNAGPGRIPCGRAAQPWRPGCLDSVESG